MGLLADRFRENVSKHKDEKMKTEAGFDIGYNTGFLNFDFLNGAIVYVKNSKGEDVKHYNTGILDGSLVTLIGRSGSGKSTFINQVGANIIRPFKTSCIFEDNIEGGMTHARKELLTRFYGEELKARCISRNSGITAENWYERIKMIHDLKVESKEDFLYNTGLIDNMGNPIFKMEPTVYILDSLTLLMPEKLADDDQLSGQMAGTSSVKLIARILRTIVPMLKSANIILFIVNHILEDVSINPFERRKLQLSYLKKGERLPGGQTPIYLSTNCIKLEDAKLKPDETFHINGATIDLTIIKSRSNSNGKSTQLILNYESGFDAELSLYLMLKDNGRINGTGVGMYLGDSKDMKFSCKNLKDKLNASVEFRKLFMSECKDVLTSLSSDTEYKAIDSDSMSSDIMDMLKDN